MRKRTAIEALAPAGLAIILALGWIGGPAAAQPSDCAGGVIQLPPADDDGLGWANQKRAQQNCKRSHQYCKRDRWYHFL